MSAKIVHDNEIIFPEPEKFIPERWTTGPDAKEAENALVAFSKGSRGCIGLKYGISIVPCVSR